MTILGELFGLPSNQLYDLGTHLLDQMLCLFGQPVNLNGQVRKLRQGTKIVDYFFLNLNYKDKVVRLKSTMTAIKADERYKMHTSKGTYYFHEMGEQEHQLIGGMTPKSPEYGDNATYDFYDIDGNKESIQVIKGNYLDYYSKLADAINNDGELPVSHEDAALLIKYLEDVMKTEM
ncbi:Gfo/Idh/MocA family oxidoreductase [Colwellia sp. MSW7]|uniref:Gfo/Idh/MocA family oxidoreductase n=1 Tax=Colwellia maritima TaxID=2912588 RepID=A0ABS9X806_9GAMM|nr:Gfo/Idh/MocA family oxidoreductase [Colwellia maritima]MCI2285626.1 Gfo/Idh/MocA family oxidoreductase [Colwellia maritima]